MEAVSQSMELLRAPSFMKSDFLVWLTSGALKRVVGSDGIIKFMIPESANQKLVLGNPSKTKRSSRSSGRSGRRVDGKSEWIMTLSSIRI